MLHFEWLDSNMFIQAQQEGHRQSSWYPANRYFSWYFPSQMERSWYFPSQIERSVAARAALEVTKWNAVHSKVGVTYVRLNKNKVVLFLLCIACVPIFRVSQAYLLQGRKQDS